MPEPATSPQPPAEDPLRLLVAELREHVKRNPTRRVCLSPVEIQALLDALPATPEEDTHA